MLPGLFEKFDTSDHELHHRIGGISALHYSLLDEQDGKETGQSWVTSS